MELQLQPWFSSNLDGGLARHFHRQPPHRIHESVNFLTISTSSFDTAGWIRPSLRRLCHVGDFTTNRIKPWQGHHLPGVSSIITSTPVKLSKAMNIATFTTDNPTFHTSSGKWTAGSLFAQQQNHRHCFTSLHENVFCDFIRITSNSAHESVRYFESCSSVWLKIMSRFLT